MHVLVPIDMVGRELQARLEAIELALDLAAHLLAVEEAAQGPGNQAARPR
jgi:hypothetical protein